MFIFLKNSITVYFLQFKFDGVVLCMSYLPKKIHENQTPNGEVTLDLQFLLVLPYSSYVSCAYTHGFEESRGVSMWDSSYGSLSTSKRRSLGATLLTVHLAPTASEFDVMLKKRGVGR